MGQKKKKRNKKFNPMKVVNADLARRAKKAVLWSWGSDQVEGEDENYKHNMPYEVVKHAASNLNRWYIQCIGCFLMEDGGYYEEMEELISEPVQSISELTALVEERCETVRKAGNSKHLIDGVWIARVYTPQLQKLAESDEWHKKQADYRYEKIVGIVNE